MTTEIPAYGLWTVVAVNTIFFILFAVSFIKPRTQTDWRAMGSFSAFIVAMFTEMYGFPFTIYLLSGWIGEKFPAVNLFTHNNGHLWQTLLGLEGDPHMHPIHLAADLFIIIGMLIVAWAWKKLYTAQKNHTLAVTGPYAFIRHPQYTGFLMVMTGFLLMWPTLLTLVMYPVLIWIYIRLAKTEETLVRKDFGKIYDAYAEKIPAFIPSLKQLLIKINTPGAE